MTRIVCGLYALLGWPLLASGENCAELDALAKDADWHRPWIGEVVGQGRAHFHSAPSAACRIAGKFIIAGDGVTIYSEYDGWVQIMYPAGDEEDAGVWVRSERLRVISRPDEGPRL
jgi:hypothetical protein